MKTKMMNESNLEMKKLNDEMMGVVTGGGWLDSCSGRRCCGESARAQFSGVDVYGKYGEPRF